MQTNTGFVIITSVSLSPHEPCLVDSIAHTLQVSWTPLTPKIPSTPLLRGYPSSDGWEGPNGDLQLGLSLCVMFGYGSLYLVPSFSGDSSSVDYWTKHLSMSIKESFHFFLGFGQSCLVTLVLWAIHPSCGSWSLTQCQTCAPSFGLGHKIDESLTGHSQKF